MPAKRKFAFISRPFVATRRLFRADTTLRAGPSVYTGVQVEPLSPRLMLSGSTGELNSGSSSLVQINANASPSINVPPTVAIAAAAFPAIVNGTTASLSVLGADDAGETNLTYTWSVIGSPPAAVVFSSNGTNAAKDVTATFAKAGAYSFLVTITDGGGLSTTSSVNVTVNQTLTSVAVTPTNSTIHIDQQEQFTATAYDQFGAVMASLPAFTWTLASGAGSISAGGLYSAPAAGGTATVEATAGSVNGSATIVVQNSAPTITQAASASPGTVTGTTTNLSVLASDDGGSGNLVYTWSVLGKPTGALSPTFSVNGNNSANSSTATFHAAGTYQFQATVTDGGGLSTTSIVTVQVSQTITSISVSPATPTVTISGTEQFSATALDQFGAVMASQPTFNWSATAGSFSGSGLYHAGSSAGTPTITASSGSVSGSTTVYVAGSTTISASSNIITGTTTTLNALGLGSLGWSYAWSVTSKPSGASTPAFSTNNSTSTSTVVTFSQAGTYTLRVDSSFLILFNNSASITVTVNQTLTSIAVSPVSANMNENGSQQFSAVGYDQFGKAMAAQPVFAWAVTSGGGNISASGGNYVAPAVATNAIVTATSGLISGSASITVTNAAPTVASAAANLTASPTAPGTINLSVLGADDGGASNLIYTWSVTGTPPGLVTFSTNGENAAQNTFATITTSGTYHFLATITDASGLSVTSAVQVSIGIAANLPATISAPGAQLTNENSPLLFSSGNANAITVSNPNNGTEQVTLTAPDGLLTLGTTTGLSFSTGTGTNDATVTFTGSVAQVNAALSGLVFSPMTDYFGRSGIQIAANAGSGNAPAIANIAITVAYVNQPPTVAATASASPTPVTGTTTDLSVLGADDGGTNNLTYVWSVTSKPAGATNPSFSLNGTNAASDTTATFTAAGSYTLLVTITDAGGLSTTSSVTVQVNQTMTSIQVAPANPAVQVNASQQFTAVAYDQFGQSMSSQPTFNWSVDIGSIDSTGMFTAPASPGSATITASSGSVSGTTTVMVANGNTAVASPGTVTGTTTTLSVLGLPTTGVIYTWSALSKPAGATDPTYSVNASTGAQATVATFFAAGSYTFQAAVDNSGVVTDLTVDVTVVQSLGSIVVVPSSTTVHENSQTQFTASGLDQFGNVMTSQPTFSWTVQSGVGAIDGSGLYTASGSNQSGPATVAAINGGITGTASVTVVNAAPTVATVAAGSSNPVTGTSTILTVLGADDGGESNLTYTWTTTGTPPAAVLFSDNGDNQAKNTIATFSKIGSYQFRVTITDAEGLSVTSNISLTVNQTLTSLTISPSSPGVDENAQQQFTAGGFDQFGNAMASMPTLGWAIVSGSGSIDSNGLFTAPAAPGLTTIAVSSGSVNARDTLTVYNMPPTVAVAANSASDPVTGISTTLGVLGADDGGESNLVYQWSTTGTIPAPVIFSANNTNGAKNVTVTFTQAGTYVFRVMIVDSGGLSTTSSVTVQVVSTFSRIIVSPANSSIERAGSAQFLATAYDQFGVALASQPAFSWSTVGNCGSIDSSGAYTAPPAGNGTTTIVATSGNISGTTTVTLIDDLAETLPGMQETPENKTMIFASGNAISISDGDPNTTAIPASITLTATDGVISLASETGLAFSSGSGNADTTMTFSGNLTDLDNALRGLTFSPKAGFSGLASLSVTINEVGSQPSPSQSVTIRVDAPAVNSSGSSPPGSGITSSGGSQTSPVLETPVSPPVLSSDPILSNPINTSGGSPPLPVDVPPPQANPVDTPAPQPTPPDATAPPVATAAPETPAAPQTTAAPESSPQNPSDASANAKSAVAAAPTVLAGAAPVVSSAANLHPPEVSLVTNAAVHTVPENVFPFLSQQSPMWNHLDTVKKEMQSQTELKVVAGTATVASLGASAAYLIWLLRGGSLLSSLLSIFPAWKSMDPLPVLDQFESQRRRRKRRGEKDDESLESLVDQSNSRTTS